MGLLTGQGIVQGDLVTSSAGSGDSGKAPKLDSNGQLDRSFMPLVVENTAGTTHSLTTVAGQRVIVWASGVSRLNGGGADSQTQLKYNGVVKHEIISDGLSSNNSSEWCLMWTDIPGAATHDITVVDLGATIESCVIIVLKI